jgi:Xaa-Pro aminopeptidase
MAITQRRIEEMRQAVDEAGLDGWLLYDFRGANPLAYNTLGLPPGAHLTRRWFLYVPRHGEPTLLHNFIEGGTWAKLIAGTDIQPLACSRRAELNEALGRLLPTGATVAMEYSPRGEVPYASRVDAGTIEWVRGFGAEVVSSADLLLTFLRWSDEDLAAHKEAAAALIEAKDAAFRLIHERLRAGKPVDELAVQAEIARVIAARGLEAGHPPNCSFGGHAADPHYDPTPETSATLAPGQCVLIDLWAQRPGRPFADITWMASAGEPSEELSRVYDAVAGARDAALAYLDEHGYRGVEGWRLHRAAEESAEAAGYAHGFLHRLGHDLGRDAVHGSGTNLDDFETHDTRRLTPGLGCTIEPGVYLPERAVGVRSEINVYFDPASDRAVVTTPVQKRLYVLGGDEPWEVVAARAEA